MWALSTPGAELAPSAATLGPVTTAPRYHHGNLRAALVEAAVEAVRAEGPSGLALRELARRVGVSHNAAYRHFADRDALVAAVAEEGMAALSRALRDALDGRETTDPVERARAGLSAIGRAYVEFALAEPGLFRVAFTTPTTLPPDPEGDEPLADPFAQLNAVLDELAEVGYLAGDLRPHAEIACWSGVHGFAVLCLDGPLRDQPAERREAALARTLELVDRSLGPTD